MRKNVKRKICILAVVAMALVLVLGLSSCGNGKKDNGQVRVYAFGDYMDPDLIAEFEEETGISVILDTFDTNEEMYPIIQKGSVNYDVICASDYMVEKMSKEGLLSEIDYSNVPNIKNIDQGYLKMAESFDPGNKYSVPHTCGTLGIMYNSDKVKKKDMVSWKDLWNKKYKQEIVMPDSMRDLMGIALKAKGYSINDSSEDALLLADNYLKKQKPLVYKYANDSARDMLIGGSADIAVVWSGEVIYSQEENPKLKYVIPKEGTEVFMDLWAIPHNAKNKTNAEKWINFMLEKQSAIKNYEYLTYCIPNVAVIDKLKDDKEKMDILFPSKEILDNCEMLKSLPPEEEDMFSKYWKDFRAE